MSNQNRKGFARITPGQLGGVAILLLVLAAMLPTFNTAITNIQNNTGQLTSALAALVVPIVVIAVIENLWSG